MVEPIEICRFYMGTQLRAFSYERGKGKYAVKVVKENSGEEILDARITADGKPFTKEQAKEYALMIQCNPYRFLNYYVEAKS